MSKQLTIPPHLPLEELEGRYRGAHDPVARSHWQIIWLLARGSPTAEVSRVTGYSVNWVREIARRYRADGPDGLGDRRHGNPGGRDRALLTPAQREQLRVALGGPAPDGGLWTCRAVAAWIGEQAGRPVAPARGWEALRALGCTPQRPRPRETRADPEAQAAFKKGASKRSSPRSRQPIPVPR
jgi:transposase